MCNGILAEIQKMKRVDIMHEIRTHRRLLATAMLGLLTLGISGLQTPAHAASLVLNGTFTLTTGTVQTTGAALNTQTDTGGTDYSGGASLTDWTISDVAGSQGLGVLYFNE